MLTLGIRGTSRLLTSRHQRVLFWLEESYNLDGLPLDELTHGSENGGPTVGTLKLFVELIFWCCGNANIAHLVSAIRGRARGCGSVIGRLLGRSYVLGCSCSRQNRKSLEGICGHLGRIVESLTTLHDFRNFWRQSVPFFLFIEVVLEICKFTMMSLIIHELSPPARISFPKSSCEGFFIVREIGWIRFVLPRAHLMERSCYGVMFDLRYLAL